LKGAEDDQLIHVLGKAAGEREGDEDDEGGHKSGLPTDDIGDAREQDGATEIGQGVGEGNPVDRVQRLELKSNGIHAGGYDCGVEHGQEEAEAQAAQVSDAPTPAQA